MAYSVSIQSSQRPARPLRMRRFHSALCLLVAALLSACASTGLGEPLAKRAQARWDALLAGDFDTAYSYYSPGYRSANTRGDLELNYRLRKVQFREARYLEQECSEDACTLKFDVKYRVGSPVPGLDEWISSTTLEEKWVKTDGQWWYLPTNR